METAKHIIYITNWHFNPETKNPFDDSLPNIGELLKKKSEEGKSSSHQCRSCFGDDRTIIVRAAAHAGGCMRVSMHMDFLECVCLIEQRVLSCTMMLPDQAQALTAHEYRKRDVCMKVMLLVHSMLQMNSCWDEYGVSQGATGGFSNWGGVSAQGEGGGGIP